jgi:hypothetical protein
MVGEAVVAFVRGQGPTAACRALLPDGIRALPGPAVVVGVSYQDSPVGPYVELAVGVPARLGLRPGLCVVFQVVSVPDAGRAYRTSWGLPAVVRPALTWSSTPEELVVTCADLGFRLVGGPTGPGVPMVLPLRTLQRRTDGPVVLPRRLIARVRRARTEVHVATEPAAPALAEEHAFLSSLGGTHAGLVLSGARILARPARSPAGLWSSLRAPLSVAEPALTVVAAPTP